MIVAESAAPALTTRRPLLTLYGTTLVSVTGNAMAAIAVPWFVLQTTGSVAQTGITAFFTVLPIVVGMFFGGTLVDRIGYKRVSVYAGIVSGVAILLIPILYYTVGLAFWQLLLLVFIGNLADAPAESAREAMLPELSAAAGMDIDRSNGLMSSVSRATGLIGAPVAGLLIATIGVPGVLLIDAITFFVASVLTQLLIPATLVEAEYKPRSRYVDDLREGFRFVERDRLLLIIILVCMVTNLIDMAMGAVTLPVYTRTIFGPERGAINQGLLVGAFGGGAVLGALAYSWRGRRLPRRWLFTIGFFQVGLRFIIYAAIPPFEALLAVMALGGFLAGPINPVIGATMYERVPRDLRARVFSLLSAGVMVATPLGGLLAGFLLERVGLQSTLLVYAAIYLLATGSLFFNPAVRRMDQSKLAENETGASPA